MKIHFETTDPRGIRIVCLEKTWYEHILVEREFDDWVDGDDWESDVIIALNDPRMIVQDVDYSERQNYYREPGNHNRFMKVCVEFIDGIGNVVTAFEPYSQKKGEQCIWLKPLDQS